MSQNWRQYLDEDYDDQIVKIQRIPHKPKKSQDDTTKKEPKRLEK